MGTIKVYRQTAFSGSFSDQFTLIQEVPTSPGFDSNFSGAALITVGGSSIPPGSVSFVAFSSESNALLGTSHSMGPTGIGVYVGTLADKIVGDVETDETNLYMDKSLATQFSNWFTRMVGG